MRRSVFSSVVLLCVAALSLQAGSIIVLLNPDSDDSTGSVNYDGGLNSPVFASGLAAPLILGNLGIGDCVDCTFEFTSGPFLGDLSSIGQTGWRFGADTSSFALKDADSITLMAGMFLPDPGLDPLGSGTAVVVEVFCQGDVTCPAVLGAAGTVTYLNPLLAPLTDIGPENHGIFGGVYGIFLNGMQVTLGSGPGVSFYSLAPSGFAGFETPEPSVFVLSGAGLLGLALARLRRRR